MSNIKLKIKTIDSAVTEVIINSGETVGVLKERIEMVIKISISKQRLIFQGRVLSDSSKLTDFKLEDGHVVHLIEQQNNGSNTNTSTGSTSNTTRMNNYENFFNMLFSSDPGLNQYSTFNSPVGMNYISSILRREENVYDIPESMRGLESRSGFNKTESIEVIKQSIVGMKELIKNASALNADNADSLKSLFYGNFQYKMGQWVDVKDTLNQWLEAQIINIRGNECQVNYNGWGSVWNEWIAMGSDRIAMFRTHTVQVPYSKYLSPCPNGLGEQSTMVLTNIQNFDNFDTIDDLISFIDFIRDKLMRISIERDSFISMQRKRWGVDEDNLRTREKVLLFLIGQVSPILDRVGRLFTDYGSYMFRYTFDKFQENFNKFKENTTSRVYNTNNTSLLNSQIENFKNLIKVNLLVNAIDPCNEESW
jgi:hypothetical protein